MNLGSLDSEYTQGCFACEKQWSEWLEIIERHNDPSHFSNATVTYIKLQQNVNKRPVMNTSTASSGYGYSFGSHYESASRSSSGSGTGYNSGSETGAGSGLGSIVPSIYDKVFVTTTIIEEKEKHIQQLLEQLRESNKAQFAMIGEGKQLGKNAMGKMKKICSRLSR